MIKTFTYVLGRHVLKKPKRKAAFHPKRTHLHAVMIIIQLGKH